MKFSETTSFEMLNKQSPLKDAIKSSISEYNHVPLDMIQRDLLLLKNSPYDITKEALKSMGNDKIQLLYPGTKILISTMIPFIVTNSSGGIVTYAYLNSVGNTAGDNYKGGADALDTLLSSAYIAGRIFGNTDKLQNASFIESTMNVYVNLIANILNTIVAIKSDKELFDIVTYALRKFFLLQMLDMSADDNIEKYCISKLNNIEQVAYEKIKAEYDHSNIQTLADLIEYLKKLHIRMKELSIRVFIEKYLRQYSQTAYFAMDNISYLIFNILGALNGISVVNKGMKDAVKTSKSINQFRSALSLVI